MKIGIMQPYLFPYIGYFQLINAVDKFIIYDDVNYIKKGWINRNNFLNNNGVKLITIPIKKASQNKLIKDLEFNIDEIETNKFFKFIEIQYSKAKYYNEVKDLLENIFLYKEYSLEKFIYNSLIEILKYLGINKKIILSSNIKKNNSLKGEEKIIEICKIMEAKTYINPIGGKDLYSVKNFENENIKLNFIKSKSIKYKQFNDISIENLSIIDVLMFNSSTRIKEMLEEYDLLDQ